MLKSGNLAKNFAGAAFARNGQIPDIPQTVSKYGILLQIKRNVFA